MKIIRLILLGLGDLFRGDYCGMVRCFNQAENILLKKGK